MHNYLHFRSECLCYSVVLCLDIRRGEKACLQFWDFVMLRCSWYMRRVSHLLSYKWCHFVRQFPVSWLTSASVVASHCRLSLLWEDFHLFSMRHFQHVTSQELPSIVTIKVACQLKPVSKLSVGSQEKIWVWSRPSSHSKCRSWWCHLRTCTVGNP